MVIDLAMTQQRRSPKSRNPKQDDLEDERVRAEDILLGALGFGEEARIISVSRTDDGYRGKGRWLDGEEFDFESDEQLSGLEDWALSVLETRAH